MVRLYTRGIVLKSFAEMRRALDDLDGIVTRAITRAPKSTMTGRLILRSGGAAAAEQSPKADGGEGAAAPDTS